MVQGVQKWFFLPGRCGLQNELRTAVLIAEKDILIVVASLVVHCCVIRKNVIVASQLHDVADVRLTVEIEGPFELLQFIHKYNLGKSVPNILMMLRIFLTIAVSVATCERSFSKLKLFKNYLRSGTPERGHCPLPFERGATGARVPLYNSIMVIPGTLESGEMT